MTANVHFRGQQLPVAWKRAMHTLHISGVAYVLDLAATSGAP